MRTALIPVMAALALPAAAHGATTVGSSLTSDPGIYRGWCTGDGPGSACTVLQHTLGSADQAVPFDGVVVAFRLRQASGPITLKVIEGSDGSGRVVATGPTVNGGGFEHGISTHPARVAVTRGQRIGFELAESAQLPFVYRDEISTGDGWGPPLGAETRASNPTALDRTYEILANATIEPDADRDGFGDESQDPDLGRPGSPPGPSPSRSPSPSPSPGASSSPGSAPPSPPELRELLRRLGTRVADAGRRLSMGRGGARVRVGCPEELRLETCRVGVRIQTLGGLTLGQVTVTLGKARQRGTRIPLTAGEQRRLRRARRAVLRVTLPGASRSVRIAV